MAASASPRKPSVPMAARSAAVRSLLVAWRRKAVGSSSGAMPQPSSRDAQIGQPAVLQLDGDVPRARVDGVFQKLLDNARGTLDDLAGGNEIGDMGG